jgi:hypothetical protein
MLECILATFSVYVETEAVTLFDSLQPWEIPGMLQKIYHINITIRGQMTKWFKHRIYLTNNTAVAFYK